MTTRLIVGAILGYLVILTAVLLCLCRFRKVRRAAAFFCSCCRRSREPQAETVPLETLRQQPQYSTQQLRDVPPPYPDELQPSPVNQPLLPSTDLDQLPPPYHEESPPTDLDQPPPSYSEESPPTDLDQPPPPYPEESQPTDLDQPPPPYLDESQPTDLDQPPPPYQG